ncbi:hypothetical protein DY000_02031184 [Brassica cretica]|uniref:Uncharacterized protein n=1 Tax=Brassica cretica TaxID=69181 RepID=A0ABQ7E0D0_BRACR|nr:hypothetical protein DY000_02031184 [Brassica cretica]
MIGSNKVERSSARSSVHALAGRDGLQFGQFEHLVEDLDEAPIRTFTGPIHGPVSLFDLIGRMILNWDVWNVLIGLVNGLGHIMTGRYVASWRSDRSLCSEQEQAKKFRQV